MKNPTLPVYLKKYAMGLTSGFTSASLLKARIKMLYQKPSLPVKSIQFLLVLPIVLLCMGVNACMQREHTLVPTAEMPKINLVKGKNGKVYEVPYFEGEKNEYELVADKIGLNNFIDKKDIHSIEETYQFYQQVVTKAMAETNDKEIPKRAQYMLLHVFFYKGMHKSKEIKDIAFLAEACIEHKMFIPLYGEKEMLYWFTIALPALKNYWSVGKFEDFKIKLQALQIKESYLQNVTPSIKTIILKAIKTM